MKASDALFKALKEAGVDTVFMLPGGGAMHLVDSLGKSGLRYITCLHEQGAGFAAIGHANYTGKTAVCLVTSGPGATNAITPCAHAWVDSVPVLFISGQAPSAMLVGDSGLRCRGPQEIGIIEMVRSITKEACEVETRYLHGFLIDHLFQLCQSGRKGPCWLSVPLDIQAEEV